MVTNQRGEPDAPAELATLVQAWHRRGRPQQRGILWPRDRWSDAFPEHADMLQNLPPTLDRAALQPICSSATMSPEAAAAAFVAVLAWGYGRVGYGVWRAKQALSTPHAAEYLRDAAKSLQHEGALAGYATLAQRSHRLPYFGPAFGTKFLAFCSPAADPKPALILDVLVSKWLMRNAGLSVNPVPWDIETYGTYLGLMYRWSATLSAPPEALELCIFSAESTRVGNQWADLN